MTDWSFANFGAEFDEHAAAHLPGYADVQTFVTLVAQHVAPAFSTIADYGCATGATAAHLATLGRSYTYVLYDDDASMLEAAEKRLTEAFVLPDQMDLNNVALPTGVDHTNASLSIMLWLLQFMPREQWRPLLTAARRSSLPTGALIVGAKTMHVDPRWQEIAVAALDDYKADAGVTPMQRAEKTKALRGTLHQATVGQLSADLTASGWHHPTVLWRWHVWTVLGAFASPLD